MPKPTAVHLVAAPSGTRTRCGMLSNHAARITPRPAEATCRACAKRAQK